MGLTSLIPLPNTRQSNIELLRIVAMFMVLILHSNFKALGIPNLDGFNSNPVKSIIECFLESFTIIAVNVFVMISGWFKIRPNIKGLSTFMFQCWFYSIGSYLLLVILHKSSFSFESLYKCISFKNDLWFVPSYLVLYILSPLLNFYIDKVSRIIFKNLLIAFYIIQTFSWILLMNQFDNGYSSISFIGLYLLSSYLHKYKAEFSHGLKLYLSCSITLFVLLCLRFKDILFIPGLWAYSNPIVILSSIGFFYIFVNLRIKNNNIINFIAKSSFAVYLLHDNYFMSQWFVKVVNWLYSFYGLEIYLFYLFLFIVIVFISGILIDQIRKSLWAILNPILYAILYKFWYKTKKIKLLN